MVRGSRELSNLGAVFAGGRRTRKLEQRTPLREVEDNVGTGVGLGCSHTDGITESHTMCSKSRRVASDATAPGAFTKQACCGTGKNLRYR